MMLQVSSFILNTDRAMMIQDVQQYIVHIVNYNTTTRKTIQQSTFQHEHLLQQRLID